jgi:hypothetical protein
VKATIEWSEAKPLFGEGSIAAINPLFSDYRTCFDLVFKFVLEGRGAFHWLQKEFHRRESCDSGKSEPER